MLGEVTDVGAVHGHAADRVEQHDVVDDGLDLEEPARPRPASPARVRPRMSPSPPDLDELGQDGQGDLLGSLAAEIESGRST